MESNVLNTIVTAGAVMASALLTAMMAVYKSAKDHRHNLDRDALQADAGWKKYQAEQARKDYERAHVLFGSLQRQFSTTGLTIEWQSDATPTKWNEKCAELCGLIDELRMLAGLADPEVSDVVAAIDARTNVCWGHFGTFLYRIQQGDKGDLQTQGFQEAHAAAREIQELAVRGKQMLEEKMRRVLEPRRR
jgi:hypothetical protein